MKMFSYSFKEAAKAVEEVLGIEGTAPSKEEQEAYKKRIKRQRIEHEKQDAEAHKMAAIDAQRVIDTSTPARADHPYLKRKQVKPHGIRQIGNNLIIPLYGTDGSIQAYQKVLPQKTANGKDKFIMPEGCSSKGGYYLLPGDYSTIYICEGFGTAASVFEATDNTTYISFSSGQLKAVALMVRKQYPDAEIVIAGDTDKSGTGQKAANAAADAIGGRVALPFFEAGELGSDWNDWAAIHGLDKVATVIERQIKDALRVLCPLGYSCGKGGVFVEHKDKEPERLTHRAVWVSALSRDGALDNWGRLVHWLDHDGKDHERALPAGMFHANGNELAQELATAGLPIVPGKERRLLQYLAAFTPDTRMTAATATGWLGDAFVMPHKTINEPPDERIIYQSKEYRASGCMSESGMLDDWRAMVRDVSPLVKFAIAVSLSAPLRLMSSTAAGGFHFYGRTSHGKTTLLQAACSVWGNAADPANAGGADVYIQRWNATRNGLEGMAASFNDLPLIIDEIGENDGRDFGRVVYALMSGTGKTRATRNGGLSQRRAWRVTLLSSGELPVSDFIENAKGGQLVRLVDIEAANLFAGREDADRMKQACAKHYGLAGIEFLKGGDLLDGFEAVTADSIGDAATPEAGRVRDRFRLVAHAGELAIRRGILPWREGEVLEACQSVYAGWKRNGNGMSDADRGIENVRNFILSYGSSRFEHDDDRRREPIDRAGSYSNDCYNFTAQAFKEACGGVLAETVKKALHEAGLLSVNETGRYGSLAYIGGKRVRVVAVKANILTGTSKTTGTSGTSGASPYVATHEGSTTDAVPLVPTGTAVPPRTTAEPVSGTAETVAAKGVAPPVPLVPPKNSNIEKVPGSIRI